MAGGLTKKKKGVSTGLLLLLMYIFSGGRRVFVVLVLCRGPTGAHSFQLTLSEVPTKTPPCAVETGGWKLAAESTVWVACVPVGATGDGDGWCLWGTWGTPVRNKPTRNKHNVLFFPFHFRIILHGTSQIKTASQGEGKE
jgi:hypothetical protein